MPAEVTLQTIQSKHPLGQMKRLRLRELATHATSTYGLNVLVGVPTANRWHAQNKITQGRLVYREGLQRSGFRGSAGNDAVKLVLAVARLLPFPDWKGIRMGCPEWTVTLRWQHSQR